MTLITMKQADFDSMSDERLGWACVAPMLLSIRGKDAATKAQVISSLNSSQQALCMFRVFYDHAHVSASEWYGWVSYLLHTPGYWSSVIQGLSYFGDARMIQLLEETKRVIEERKQGLGEQSEFHPLGQLERDSELSVHVAHWFAQFQELEPYSLNRISTFIRANPHDFVRIEG